MARRSGVELGPPQPGNSPASGMQDLRCCLLPEDQSDHGNVLSKPEPSAAQKRSAARDRQRAMNPPPEFFHHGERFLLRLRLRTPDPLAATQCPSVAQIPRGAGAFCQSDETRCRGGRRTPVSRSCRPGSRGGSPFRSRIATPIACPRAEAGAGSANPSWQAAPLVCEPLLIPPNLRGPRRSGRMRRP